MFRPSFRTMSHAFVILRRTRVDCLLLQACTLLFVSVATLLPCSAQNSKHPNVVPANAPKEQPIAERNVPLLQQALKLSDFTGAGEMKPGPVLAAQLTHISGFTQSSPDDGKPATEETEVWIGGTSSALNFVFVCHDHNPSAIRTHLARRENILKDDNVSVLLDPFADHRRGVLFTVNPSAVQADAAWTENNNPDYSYDQSGTQTRASPRSGWIALISIPYRSLRFRPGAQGWGAVFMRSIPRNSESDNWPRIAANISGVLPQEGTLRGVEGVTGSRNLQI